MKRRIISVILSSLIMTGCGSKQISDIVETGETTTTTSSTSITTSTTTDITTIATEETTTATTTTTVEISTESTTTEQTTAAIPEPTEDDEGGAFDVDRGFFVTRIIVPISLLTLDDENVNLDEKIAQIKSDNDYILDIELSGDNAIYVIKTSEYNKLKRETKTEIEKQLDDIVNDSANTIVRIDYDDDFANIYCYVTSQSEYQSDFNSMSLLGVVLSIRLSNAMLDFFADKTTLHVIDNQTGTEFVTKEQQNRW